MTERPEIFVTHDSMSFRPMPESEAFENALEMRTSCEMHSEYDPDYGTMVCPIEDLNVVENLFRYHCKVNPRLRTIQMLSIARDFSQVPGGRLKWEGPFTGQHFREDMLVPKLTEMRRIKDKNQGWIEIDLWGVEGLPATFLEETFGGLVREHGFDGKWLHKVLHFFPQDDEEYFERKINDIWRYIDDAAANV